MQNRVLCAIAAVPVQGLRLIALALILAGVPALQATAQGTAAAQQGGVIQDIRVEGNQRVETSSVVALSNIRRGDPFDPDVLNEAVKDLYGTGFFRAVELGRSGSTLIIRISENPVVNEVAFEGNFTLKDDALDAEIRTKSRDVLTVAKVRSDVQRLLGLYRASGRYDIEINPVTIPLNQNRVNLVYEIEEGPRSLIRSINFLGNRTFTDRRLRREIISRQAAPWRFISGVTAYDPNRIGADGEFLRRYYMERGFADFKIKTTTGDLRENDRTFAVTFDITEGARYRIGRIQVTSEIKGVSVEALRRAITMRGGDWYSIKDQEESVEALRENLGDLGYAFVTIEPELIRRQGRVIDMLFKVGEGNKVFVERINISGNSRTLDRVLRREFRLVEGDPFSVSKLRTSRQRLQALGYFSDVRVNNRRGSAPDRTVVDVEVEETSTGSLLFGAAYSSAGGVSASVELEEKNLLGRGTQLNTKISFAENNQTFDFGLTEPYFLGRNLTASVDLNYSNRDLTDSSGYTDQTIGGGVGVGYRINENIRQNWGVSVRYSDIEVTNASVSASPFLLDEQGTTLRASLSHSLTYTNLDNFANPRKGVRATMSNVYTGFGGDVNSVRNRVSVNAFLPIGELFTVAAKAEGGILTMLDNEGARISDRFLMGSSDVRGFSATGIGPRTGNAGQALGGTKSYNGTIELRAPIPLPVELDIEGRVFYDIGAVWDIDTVYSGTEQACPAVLSGNDCVNDSSDPRQSYGFGLTWQSPLGPLQLDWGYPISQETFDVEERFSFSIGTRF